MPVVALLVPFLKNLRVFNLLPQPPPLSPQNAPLYDSGSMASVGNASASSPQAQLDSSSMITPTEVERLERRLGKEDFYSVRILGVGNCFWRISAVVRWEKKVRLYRNQIFLEPPNTGPHEPWCPMEEDEKAEELAEYQRDTSDPLGLAMGERGKVQKRKIQRVYDRDELSDYGIIREAVWGLSY